MGSLSRYQINNALSRANTILNDSLVTITYNATKYKYWPLFFCRESDDFVPCDVDTCGNSVGIVAFYKLLINFDEKPNLELLKEPVKTLLWMRNNDGYWPSLIPYGQNNPQRMEGVINDTVFALNALVDLGFLNNTPDIQIEYDPKTNDSIKDISDRIKLILKGVDWLISNRIKSGWYYTGVEYFQDIDPISPALLPTAKVALLLNKVLSDLNNLKEKDNNKIANLNRIKTEANKWISSIQNEDWGFGKKRGEKSSAVHTAIAVRALLCDVKTNNSNERAVLNGCKFLLKTNIARSSENDIEKVFDEYSQIIINDKNRILKRNIVHENFLEGNLLVSLIECFENGIINNLSPVYKNKFRRAIKKISIALLDLQEKTDSYMGAFKSHRNVPRQNYPIYALEESVNALILLKLNIDKIVPNKYLIRLIFRNTIISALLFFGTCLLAKYQKIDLKIMIIVTIIQVLINFLMSSLQFRKVQVR